MDLKQAAKSPKRYCRIPRRREAEQALVTLAWKKNKKQRPKWLIEELEYIQKVHFKSL